MGIIDATPRSGLLPAQILASNAVRPERPAASTKWLRDSEILED
jgi:hypothetical protein